MDYKFELLQELCTICKDHDIPYYLYGTQMQAAYSDGLIDPEWDSYDIAVTGSGFRKLQEVCSSESFRAEHPDRVLESMLTNPHFPGYYANFVATDTLHFDMRDGFDWYQNKGMPIHVLIIANRAPDTRKGNLIRFLRDAHLEMLHRRGRTTKDKVIRHLYNLFFAICGTPLKRKLFNNHVNSWKSASRPSGLYLADGRYVTFRRNFWKADAVRILGGVPFTVPQRCLRKKVFHRFYNLNVVHSDSMSYDEFSRLCHDQNIDLRSIYRHRRKPFFTILDKLLWCRVRKRYYNSAFYSTMIRHGISRMVEKCQVRSLEDPEYSAIMEEYLDYIIQHSQNGTTPYITFGLYMDAMRVLLKRNRETYHSSNKNVTNIMLKYADKIPDHFFLKSPVVAESCYSPEETGKDAKQLRAELEASFRELIRNEADQEQ